MGARVGVSGVLAPATPIVSQPGVGWVSVSSGDAIGRAPPWAKQLLGHGHPNRGYPWRGVSSGHHALGRGSPTGGGHWACRLGGESLPHYSAEGVRRLCVPQGVGRRIVPAPWHDPDQTPLPQWFRRASRGSPPTGLLQTKATALQTDCRWHCRHTKAGQSN